MPPRLFIQSPPEKEITITGHDAKYLIRVLRCKPGDEVTLVDRQGVCYQAEITGITGKEVVAGIKGPVQPAPESPIKLILLQGVLKAQKMDLVIQKAVELGASSIIPVITERVVVSETRKLPRWQSIALEAARQCGRAIIPPVMEPVKLREFFSKIKCPIRGIVFWEEGGAPLKEVIADIRTPLPAGGQAADVYVLIGPEGGLAEEEVELAQECGLNVATMGERILKAETAAISALTVLQYELGDFG